MVVLRKELKKGARGFIVWTLAITFMLVVCIVIYPEMKGEIEGVQDIFSNMGAFSDAFGMNQLNFGTLIGYYGIECGNTLGMGGGFFAAIIGISILSKEEKNRTAEFLLTHPIRRSRVIVEKLFAVLIQVVIFNLFVTAMGYLTIKIIGESVPDKEFLLIHMGYFLLQLEIALICFGFSAFIKRGGVAIGVGFATFMYFANLLSNITEKTEFLKYITPFAYADPASIVSDRALDVFLVTLGMCYAVLAVLIGFLRYSEKDIAS
ncbi:MAG: ABC transporter permease [Ruminococcus sp.]|nr:ABC transporter permease [Ruminococcus sp.]